MIQTDSRNNWLSDGIQVDFTSFIPMGTKKAKNIKGITNDVIFKIYSLGVSTNRDAWSRNYNSIELSRNIGRMIETYNNEVVKWDRRITKETELDDFLNIDNTKICWSEALKRNLLSGKTTEFDEKNIRISLYRPFTKSYLYFHRMMTERVYVNPSIFPTTETEAENLILCVAGIGNRKGFGCLVSNKIPTLDLSFEKNQGFPFYIYDEDGSNRRENITDWALNAFQTQYKDDTITKWDIFHYNYGLLHHPEYREKYQANLKRDLPHIPYVKDFWGFANAGARLAEIHVNYESQPEYDPLKLIQNPDVPLNWRVEKMKLSKDKTSLVYNDFLTIDGIPPKALEYRLGTRSALEWIVNQYCVKTDKRSGIVNDPNRENDPQYIVRLIGQVITVSLETVDIVAGLPELDIQYTD